MAVKIVGHDGDVAHRMDVLRESLLSANIQHPNVVSTYKARSPLPRLPPRLLPQAAVPQLLVACCAALNPFCQAGWVWQTWRAHGARPCSVC